MVKIRFEGREFDCREGETVLDALLRQGQSPPFSCRNGSCLVCLRRCVRGEPTEASQRALRPSLRRAGYFLPCKCKPQGSMEIEPPRAADLFSRAVVAEKEIVGDVCILRLESATSLYYHAGQFLNLRREDGLMRSYSLASLPTEDYLLEVHVKRMPGGAMSEWIFDTLSVGDELDYQGPNGHVYYVSGTEDQDLLLVGNGTGAAPLLGIVRDAIDVGHRGRIRLFFGSRTREGLYLHDRFDALANAHPNIEYVPCLSGEHVPEGFARGRVHDIALARCPELRGHRVFVAGHPAMVAAVEAAALTAGLDPSEVHADPYEVRSAPEKPPPVAEGATSRRAEIGTADPEMWQALREGELLREILHDFYTQVFEDSILSPYFHNVTKERVVGQVFSFMRDVFKGERSYFGMRPRTAHHWMVISDAIFDHREAMMVRTLRKHGLPEHLVSRWRKFEEGFRGDIVKPTPWALVIDGVEMPLDGFGEEELTVGTMCDGCQRAVEVGERVRYHLRLGLTYCTACAFSERRQSSAPTASPAGGVRA